VWVRRRTRGGSWRGQVEDVRSSAEIAEAERGTGLRLVEGLVSRELRGRFELSPKTQGGTVAQVEIPLG
jgi:two-component sensor histidine kinase